MKLKNIKDPWISKEQFSNVSKVSVKLNYSLWVEFVESNLDYFTWLENTEKGKKTLAGIDKVPESFREGVLKSHNKMQAPRWCAIASRTFFIYFVSFAVFE